jgi:hypothetical protein
MIYSYPVAMMAMTFSLSPSKFFGWQKEHRSPRPRSPHCLPNHSCVVQLTNLVFTLAFTLYFARNYRP